MKEKLTRLFSSASLTLRIFARLMAVWLVLLFVALGRVPELDDVAGAVIGPLVRLGFAITDLVTQGVFAPACRKEGSWFCWPSIPEIAICIVLNIMFLYAVSAIISAVVTARKRKQS